MRLTHSLEVTLRKIAPHEMDLEFGRALESGHSPIDGMSAIRLINDIDELKSAGALVVPEGEPITFTLTSEGRDYFRNKRTGVLGKVLGALYQLVSGAAGGLVVWVLSRLLG